MSFPLAFNGLYFSVCSWQKLMEVNYLGSVYPTRAVITTMKERRMGRIMFVSSQAGQIGLFGYTAYSPSKFALRGLAESLQMEVSVSKFMFYFEQKRGKNGQTLNQS